MASNLDHIFSVLIPHSGHNLRALARGAIKNQLKNDLKQVKNNYISTIEKLISQNFRLTNSIHKYRGKKYIKGVCVCWGGGGVEWLLASLNLEYKMVRDCLKVCPCHIHIYVQFQLLPDNDKDMIKILQWKYELFEQLFSSLNGTN